MSDIVSIEELRRAIEMLPSDEPRDNPAVWYRTQKEHWLGWLAHYRGQGAYGRKYGTKRDARFVYNHIVEPLMLLWLIAAAGVDSVLVAAAKEAASGGASKMAQSAAIRKQVPWEAVQQALFAPRTGKALSRLTSGIGRLVGTKRQ